MKRIFVLKEIEEGKYLHSIEITKVVLEHGGISRFPAHIRHTSGPFKGYTEYFGVDYYELGMNGENICLFVKD